MKRVLGSIRRADERYHLIENGDKICIGVSGGKDSLLLMEALQLYQRFARTDFQVCAVTLDLGIREQNWSDVEAFAQRIGMDYRVLKTDIGDVVFNIRKEPNPCALCAKLRRGALNNAAKDLGCNKVALGHNREDVIETFLMSLLYEGRVNTFAPVTYLSRSDVTLIRPLVFLPESMHSLLPPSGTCPFKRRTAPPQGTPSGRRQKKSFGIFPNMFPILSSR